jgi:circadian clock protein KaiC
MSNVVEKLATRIPGFDLVAAGGVPRGRATLVSGSPGSGKTLLAAQFLAEGAATGESGVFVALEESPRQIRANVASLGWDISGWESAGRWMFVDMTPYSIDGIDGLLTRLEYAVRAIGAQRVAIDSLSAVFASSGVARGELRRLIAGLGQLGVTTLMTAERAREDESAVEEFVVDSVVVLRNTLVDEKRRRTLEILKVRGAAHQKGEFPFIIQPGAGIVVSPLSAIELSQRSSTIRITSGNTELDGLCGGGFFRDSVTLVSGATGTGKTLMSTEFVGGGTSFGERCLLLSFEESRDQLFRNAMGWGRDFAQMEREGLLRVSCTYPEAMPIEEHLLQIKRVVDDFKPGRVSVDSLSALQRVSTPRSFREFAIDLTAFVKEREIAGLFTSTTPAFLGGQSVTESHISTIADAIVLLRYIELQGEIRRGIAILKMRGSPHDKQIREFSIDDVGMHIGTPFHNLTGILTGNPRQVSTSERARVPHLRDGED